MTYTLPMYNTWYRVLILVPCVHVGYFSSLSQVVNSQYQGTDYKEDRQAFPWAGDRLHRDMDYGSLLLVPSTRGQTTQKIDKPSAGQGTDYTGT